MGTWLRRVRIYEKRLNEEDKFVLIVKKWDTGLKTALVLNSSRNKTERMYNLRASPKTIWGIVRSKYRETAGPRAVRGT